MHVYFAFGRAVDTASSMGQYCECSEVVHPLSEVAPVSPQHNIAHLFPDMEEAPGAEEAYSHPSTQQREQYEC